MVHESQGLALGLEAGNHRARIHARLEHLQGHGAAEGLLLLGQEDHAKAPFADLFAQLVRANLRARSFADIVKAVEAYFVRRRRQKGRILIVHAEQRFDPGLQGGVFSAGLFYI